MTKNFFPIVKHNEYLSLILSVEQKPLSVYGDFLVSIADFTDPKSGKLISSKTERIAVINGIRYKAVVSGRREQMTSKYNIPMNGAIVNKTAYLDESPAIVISVSDYAKFGVEPSRTGNSTVVAQIGGQITYFNNSSDLEKYVNNQIFQGSKIGANIGEIHAQSTCTQGAKKVLFIRVDFSNQHGVPVDTNGGTLTDSAARSTIDSVGDFFSPTQEV